MCVTSLDTKVAYDGLDWLLAGREFYTVGTVRMEILDSMYGTASSGRVDRRGVGQADGMGPAVYSGMLASTFLERCCRPVAIVLYW